MSHLVTKLYRLSGTAGCDLMIIMYETEAGLQFLTQQMLSGQL